jgi:hypothetical protein
MFPKRFSGDNVNLLLPGFELPVAPNCRARRPAEPAAEAPPSNINNVDIGWNVLNKIQLFSTFLT